MSLYVACHVVWPRVLRPVTGATQGKPRQAALLAALRPRRAIRAPLVEAGEDLRALLFAGELTLAE